jgi:hypothetical protein
MIGAEQEISQCHRQRLPLMKDRIAWTDCCFTPGMGPRASKHSWASGSCRVGLIRLNPIAGGRSLLRAQYNALARRNLAAIERIVVSKYQRGAALNRQHPFVDILLSDIMESGEVLDTTELVREPPPPDFKRMSHHSGAAKAS